MASITAHLSLAHLKTHLLDVGFDSKKVNKFIEAPYHIDSAKALLKSYAPPPRNGKGKGKAIKGKYKNLCLYKRPRDQNWVIYEPTKHTPLLHADMLILIIKFAIHQPGNPRFIEFNTRTRSLRIRSSRILAGMRVVYTAKGPVLQMLDDGAESEEESEESGAEGEEESGAEDSIKVQETVGMEVDKASDDTVPPSLQTGDGECMLTDVESAED